MTMYTSSEIAQAEEDAGESLNAKVMRAMDNEFDQGMNYSENRADLIAHFKCARSTAEKYIKQGRELYAAYFLESKPEAGSRLSATLWRCISGAEKAQEFSAVASLAEKIMKLYGLESETKVSLSANIDEAGQAMLAALAMTPEQRRRALEGSEARALGAAPEVLDVGTADPS